MNNLSLFWYLIITSFFFFPTISLAKTNKVTLPKAKLIKQWAEVGENIGDSGFYSADLDGDGNKEIIFGNSNNRRTRNSKIAILKEVRRDESNSPDKYEIVKEFSLPDSAEFERIYGFHDKVSDNHFLAVISSLKEVFVFNLSAQSYISKLESMTTEQIDFADLDNDNITEMLLVSEDTLTSINMQTWQVEKNYQISGEKFLKNNRLLTFQAGYFLDSQTIDIAFTNGNIYREKAGSFELVWTINKPASYDFAHDVNKDGLDELVGAKCTLDVLNRSYIVPEGKNADESECSNNRSSPKSAIDPKTGNLISFMAPNTPYTLDLKTGPIVGVNTVTWQENTYAYPRYSSLNKTKHSTFYALINYHIDDIDNDGLLETISTSVEVNSSTGAEVITISGTNWLGMSWVFWDYETKTYALSNLGETNDIELFEFSYQDYYNFDTYLSQYLEFKAPALNRFNTNTLSSIWEDKRKPYSQVFADINGDGKNNVISTHEAPFSYEVSILVEGIGYIYNFPDRTHELIHSDLTFDGKDEILLLHANSTIAVFKPDLANPILYSTNIESSKITGSLKGLQALDFDHDGVQEVIVRDSDSLFIYWLEANRVEQFNFEGFGDYTSAIIKGKTRLLSTNEQGELVSFTQEIVPSVIAKICDRAAMHLSVNDNAQVYYICDNKLGVIDLNSQAIIYQELLNHSPDQVQILHSDDLSYLLTFAGSRRFLFKIDLVSAETISLENLNLTTTSNNKIEGKVLNADGLAADGFYTFSAPENGKIDFINRQAGIFNYTPNNGFSGTDEFVIASINSQGNSAKASVSVKVLNTVPTINNQSFTTHWNLKLTAQLTAVDIDNQPLEFSVKSQPSFGAVQFIDSTTGQFDYIPSIASLEPSSFNVMVNDGYSNSEANIIINHTNSQPTAKGVSRTFSYDDVIKLQLIGSDADGDPLTYELLDSVTSGELSLDNTTGILSYKLESTSDNEININFRVSDGISYSELATINITIQGKAIKKDSKIDKDNASGGAMLILLFILLLCLALRALNYKEKIALQSRLN
ncbi:hypothetical protein PCIT_a1882 [Pseudoalteromonas citrea]|uniref:Cadherin domain-containing protein n=2 Tax=Pseudoalteromonas citrea TaxID=43655 RepID=A0AAD4AIY7_9GAMM|nr:Ig-like domain-containing protein [Pseudoalteromonas citrea]KAF7771916.1 hypothetical protein PCIT_a1882 [Pseudoalteromonas citrea]